MMTQKKRYKIAVIIILVIAAACGPIESPMRSVSIVATTITPTKEGPQGLPATAIAKPTTGMPVPTLEPTLQNQFYALLKNNGGCELPCFLGITPRKTHWLEANSILEIYAYNRPIGYDKTRSTPTHRIYEPQILTYAQDSSLVSMNIYMTVEVDENDLIQDIVATVEIFGDGSTEYTDKHMTWYSLHEIFLRIGPPDAVYFALENRGYRFNVVYEKLKMLVSFSGRTGQNANNEFSVCPNIGEGQVSSIRIALAASSNPIDIKTLIPYSFSENDPLLERTTGMNLNDFYDLMIGKQNPACFQIK